MKKNNDIKALERLIVDALEDVKGKDIVVFDTEHLSALFERVIIVSGSSNRQTKALASSVRDKLRDANLSKPRIEGEANGEWIIVDCDSAVVHVMQPIIREYYRLEEIWGEKPVRMRLAKAKGLVKASSDAMDDQVPAKPALKVAVKTKPASKVATKAKPAAASKAAPKPATAAGVKTAPAKKLGGKKPVVKVAAKTTQASAAQKLVGKKAPAKKTSAKKTTAKSATPIKKVMINAPKPAKTSHAVAKRPAAKKMATTKTTPSKTVAKRAPAKTAKPTAKSIAKPAAKK